MAKRGENIYKRKDGRYEGRYIKGRHPNGKPFFGYIYGYTYAQVKTGLITAKAAASRNKLIRTIGKGSLAELLVYWLEEIKRGNVKPSTYAQYHHRIYKQIIPSIGMIAVFRLNKEQVQVFTNRLVKDGLAPSTIKNVVGLLDSAMKYACDYKLTTVNPCIGLTLPSAEKSERKALDRMEQLRLERLLPACEKGLEKAVVLALYSGLRIGEACALRWKDIDLFSGTLAVRGTLQRVKAFEGASKTKIVLGAPKSQSSQRTIPLPPEVTNRLRKWSAGMNRDSFVLTDHDAPMEPRTLRARYKRAAKRADINAPFHALRHTFATRCLENNFVIQTLSELLGHASAQTTMKVYTHSVLAHKRLLIGRIRILSEEYEPSNEPSQTIAAY